LQLFGLTWRIGASAKAFVALALVMSGMLGARGLGGDAVSPLRWWLILILLYACVMVFRAPSSPAEWPAKVTQDAGLFALYGAIGVISTINTGFTADAVIHAVTLITPIAFAIGFTNSHHLCQV